mmetsp:Transcript_26799/g.39651  ORF Transcript_26799/g.39651 Transcript_26799/m.39651 type:complete len:438 (+) Transcript_26799:54-1367(+)
MVKAHVTVITTLGALGLFGLTWLFHSPPTTTTSSSQQQLFRRKLSYAFEDFQDEEYFDQGNFRVLSFGTSRAWGAGLPDPTTQTYAALLGRGTNLAIRASDARYPAMCAHSMVQDAIYDVIVIEYMPHMYSSTKQAMLRLGERMRQRFPDAMIIYIDMWTIDQFKINGTTTIPAMDEYYKAIANIRNDDLQFQLADDMAMMRETVQKESIRAHVLQYDVPEPSEYKEAIQTMRNYYNPDHKHWSQFGMKWLKHKIIKVIRENQHKRSDRVRIWQSKDECLSWYQDGSERSLHTNMPMVAFRDGKFALEAIHSDLNFIRIDNTASRKPKHAYLSFMGTGPSDDVYGGARVELHPEHPTTPNATAVVNIDTLMTWYPAPWHVVRHKYIGEIQPGLFTYLTIAGNQTGKATQDFRAVGFNVVTEEPLQEKFSGEDLRAAF